MATPLRPERGGFLRPFGAAQFIVSFLKGEGPNGSAGINPAVGAPQADIHREYKTALHRAFAEDMVALEEERRAREGLPPLTVEEADRLTMHYLERIPSKLTRMRYHSFLVYFGMLKRLGWVETTDRIEPSAAQQIDERGIIRNPQGKLRTYYRLTDAGWTASLQEVMNPLRALYPKFTAEYFRAKRHGRRYSKRE